MASSRVLVALSEALEVPIDYFFRDFEVKLDRIRFRKASRLPKKEQGRVEEEARDFFERYCEIEEIVGCEVARFEFPGRLRDAEDFEGMALALREEWKMGEEPIPNVHALLEEKGIKVWMARDHDDGFDGFSADTDRGPVIVVSGSKSPARVRMTALHELAHILSKPLGMDEKEEEKFVPRFTGAILLPGEALRAALGRKRSNITLGELLEIKKRFGVSMGGVLARARELEIITAETYAGFYRFGPAKKWRSEKAEPHDEELRQLFPETSTRFRQLVFRAFGEELITLSQAAAYLGKSVDETHRLLNAMAPDERP